jgi:hypothetical protein
MPCIFLDSLEQYNGAVTAVATVFIGIFTWVLAWVTSRQARLTREIIDLAREEFVSTHRPKIIVRGLEFAGGIPGGEKPIKVAFRYVNAGDTKAEITTIGSKLMHMFKPTLSSGIDFKHEKLHPPIEVKCGMHGIRLTVDELEPSDPFLLNAVAGSHKLICVGYIRYRDDNGTIRQTGFCREYDAPSNRWIPVKDDEYEYSY